MGHFVDTVKALITNCGGSWSLPREGSSKKLKLWEHLTVCGIPFKELSLKIGRLIFRCQNCLQERST